ncbi:unnamed protein product [Hermetia illucens]|uniref:Protein phosphatase 1 regulatory subunit 16A n=1 Tax=Hermetia illucens TaxID=343691 RepID=A0A7R8UGX8_HERIL|nr:protein phosphatase 1 regulatory subunit 16A-like [Hermetia illucens]XP_037904804.1 protein phosphatase 1 regulatory subunit 16A-like [Hermetia illucens]CAD7080364.1 unnamed protein product [Hermetia illucens]
MDHADLIAEMPTVENLPTQDRLHLARMRRAQQLKVARQKEKEWQKQQRRERSQQQSQHSQKLRRHISFENSVVLLEAAGRNDIHEVANLLQQGMTPDASNEDGLTALHQCCIDNNIEMLKLLLDYGANVDAQDSDKWTPLHAAATCGHLELVKILISRGANLLAVNTDGNMPYDLCDDEETLDYIEAEMSKRGVTQELIDDTRALTEKQMLNDLMELASIGGDLDVPDHQGATPLHIASANGYTRVVEFLLEHHVNVDAVDKDLWSPVHAAACWGHMEVLEMLAQYGADLNAKNKDDETPSDICEDPEIRERIEQLRTEQESKRLAEAQRRRVRRSQSNNTRAQSVRRTSLRDKTLTTKKDAVEETRLRLQAQEVFIAPDSTTESKTASTTPTSNSTEQASHNQINGQTISAVVPNNNHSSTPSLSGTTTLNGGSGGIANDANTTAPNSLVHSSSNANNNPSNGSYSSISTNHNNNNNNPNHNNNNTAARLNGGSGGGGKGGSGQNSLISYSNSYPSHIEANLNSRRPPEGKDNEEFAISREKMIIGSNSVTNLHKISNDRSTEIFSASKENGKINVQVTVLVDTHNLDSSMTGATLANLKKQRSQSRSSTLSENGSVIATTAATTSHHSLSPIATIKNSTATTTGTSLAGGNVTGAIDLAVVPTSVATNSIAGPGMTASSLSSPQTVTKFSGVTGDVVSDSTRSKKCCLLM